MAALAPPPSFERERLGRERPSRMHGFDGCQLLLAGPGEGEFGRAHECREQGGAACRQWEQGMGREGGCWGKKWGGMEPKVGEMGRSSHAIGGGGAHAEEETRSERENMGETSRPTWEGLKNKIN